MITSKIKVASSISFHFNLFRVPLIQNRMKESPSIGRTISLNSFITTATPLIEKKFLPIGETSIGVIGKKNLSEEKGMNKPTPKPPLVNISKKPWDIIAMKKRKNNFIFSDAFSFKKAKRQVRAKKTANRMEWVKPLCPSICS